MKSIKLALAAFLSFFTLSTFAQPVIIETFTVEELVNDYLLGDGVDATNITYNGVDADLVTVQVKLFQGTSSILDFDEGIIMASGDAGTLLGNPAGAVEIQIQNDPDLVEISGQNINDASIIEFDFIVASDSLKFNYSFGSREYPGFTCTGFNDAFGFFLSGPGINGPFSDNAENIALIPNSDIAVAINTVNGGSPTGSGTVENCESANPNWIEDSQYFVDNDPPAPNDFDVPGLTQTFTAEAAVQCGEEYHIKLAIGDALDTALDSYVFLEAGSFAAFGQIFASFDPVFNDGGTVNQEGFDSIPVAGCTSPLIELVRPQGSTFASIEFELGGDAVLSPDGTPGSGDYWVPDGFPSDGFPDGVDTVFFEIETINPNITDTLDIQLFIIYVTCAGVQDTTTIEIPIAPPPDIDIFTEDLTLICPADTLPLQLEPTAEGGLLPHIYEWFEPGEPPYFEDQDLMPAVPEDQETFFVRVTDQCEFNYDTSQVVVTNAFPPTFQSAINPFTQPDCPNQSVELTSFDPSGTGSPPYVYFWESINSSDVAGNQPSVFVTDINPVALGFRPSLEVALTLADSCGRLINDTVQINYPAHDTLSAFFTPLEDNCPDQPVLLESIVEGGFGEYTYEWSIDGESTFTDGFGPNTANTFINDGPGFNTFFLTVRDECGRRGEDMVLDGSTDEDGNLIRTGSDSHSQEIPYINLDPPTVITPNGDGQNEVFVVPGINAFESASVLVYDRWGRLVYENNSYDAGTPDATVSQGFSAEGYEDGTYYYIVNIDNGECVVQKELQVLRGSD
jgi:gliding motility-associated-like protein